MCTNRKEEPVSALLATKTCKNTRSKASNPFPFNKHTRQSRAFMRGLSKRDTKIASTLVPELQKIRSEPTAHAVWVRFAAESFEGNCRDEANRCQCILPEDPIPAIQPLRLHLDP
jgi:hypothetical protein